MASVQVDSAAVVAMVMEAPVAVENLAAPAPAAEVEQDEAVAAEVQPPAVIVDEDLETSEADGAEEVQTLGEADGEPAAEAEVADATATAAEEPAAVDACEGEE